MKSEEVKIIQNILREYKVKELYYEVYCDRVVFIGASTFYLSQFCWNRKIIYNRDRGGFSINLKDADKIGLPTVYDYYCISKDSRKNVEPKSKTKATKIN